MTPEHPPDIQQPTLEQADGVCSVQDAQDDQAQLSTPPGEPNDVKNSRKREREVSLEPATPQATTLDIDSERAETKERRTPAKKNRTSDGTLEAPQEQAEDDAKLNGSPPHETKIRQISQGVEDITWRNMKKAGEAGAEPEAKMEEDAQAQDGDVLVADSEDRPAVHAPSAEVASQVVVAEVEKPPAAEENVSPAAGQETVVVPPLMRGENPPVLNDTAGDEEDTGAAAGAEHPPDARVAEAPQLAGQATLPSELQAQLSDAPRLPLTQRRDSDSDQEKGLKRKLGDRTVSERLLPGETVPGRNGVTTVGAMKRPRDDPEADPNTREKKRPTPPPEEDEKTADPKIETPPADAAPKFGGFMAYASTSSPFASVSGPRIFGGKQPSTSPWAAVAAASTNSSGSAASPFSSFNSSPSPFAAAAAAATAAAAPAASKDTPPSPAAHKRTGFEAFASSTSPFASAAKRPKSPPPPSASASLLGRSRSPSRHGTPVRASSAFSAYAMGGAQGFAAPTPKRSAGAAFALGEGSSSGFASPSATGSGSGSGSGAFGGGNVLDAGTKDDGEEESERESGKEGAGVSFGERLRAGKDKDEDEASDEEKRLNLTEQDVVTGEEEEETVYQVRGKLFSLSSQNQWKERGTGMLRLNVRREDGGGARLVMRKEAVYAVLLNATLFKGMRCFLAQDPRYLRFSVFEDNVTTHYNLRVSSAKIAEELLEEINAHIPIE